MKNYRGGGSKFRQIVTAASARTGGSPVVEDGFAGVAEVNAAIGQRYALRRDGEFEFPTFAAAAKGANVVIAANGTLSVAQPGAAGAAPFQFGRVSAVPGNSNTGTATEEPKAGSVWVAVSA